MTSGALPPGSTSGKAFIFDPKMANENETDAVVKLKFLAINNQPMLCVKKMNLRRKNNKLEFKKIDNILKTKGKGANEKREYEVSHSAAEIERQVPELLGVSKAILENVIFCHQEDSLWPFKDNATLKGIFDELFETTKFTKLYGALQKLYKENRKKQKEAADKVNKDQFAYQHLVNNMKQMRAIIENIRTNMREIKLEKAKKEQLQAALRQENYEERLRLVTNNKNLNEYKQEELKKKLNFLLDKLTDVEHSTDDFSPEARQAFLKNLESEVQQAEIRLLAEKEELETLSKQFKELKNVTVDFDVCEEKKEISRLSDEIFKLLEVTEGRDKIDSQGLITMAHDLFNDKELEVIDKEKNIDDQRQENMESLVAEKATIQYLEKEKASKTEILTELLTGTGVNEYQVLESQKKKLLQDIEKCKEDFKPLKSKKVDLTTAINDLIRQMTDDSENKKKFKLSQEYVEYHTAKRKLAENREEQEKKKSKITLEKGENLSVLGLEAKMEEIKQIRLLKNQTELQNAEKERITLDALQLNADRTKEELTQENESIMSRIKEAFKDIYPEDVDVLSRYDVVKAHISTMERDLSSAAFARGEFLNYIFDSSKDKGQCLVCDSEFTESTYTSRKEFFARLISDQTADEKDKLKEVADFKEELQLLKKFKPDIKKVLSNKAKVIELEEQIKGYFTQIGEKQYQIKTLKNEGNKLEYEKSEIQEMQNLLGEEENLVKKINSTDPSKFEEYDDRTLMEIYEKGSQRPPDLPALLAEKQASMNILEENISKLDENMNDYDRKLNNVNKKISSLSSEKKDQKSVAELEMELEAEEKKIQEQKAALSEKEKAITEAIKVKEKELQEEKSVLTRLDMLLKDLERRHSNLLKLNDTGLDQDSIEANYKKYKETGRKMDGLQESIQALSKQLETKKKEVTLLGQKIELQETERLLRETEDKLLMENSEIEALVEKVKEEKDMTTQFNEASNKMSRLEGIDEAHKKSAEDYYAKIFSGRLSEMQYFESLTQYEYHRLLVEDLDLYLQALESALVRYHREKVDTINKNIAELWRLTYQNGDIQKIEIKAEPITAAGEEAKANFEYKVVFYGKDNIPMEMRGRSSTGQKVLASIVIRIALAEAFGANCGVLALDEPTTNLDTANIEALARFLADLLEQRKEDGSFQLIVITHDRDFLRLFYGHTDHYYHVSKDCQTDRESKGDDSQFSCIVRRDIDDILKEC